MTELDALAVQALRRLCPVPPVITAADEDAERERLSAVARELDRETLRVLGSAPGGSTPRGKVSRPPFVKYSVATHGTRVARYVVLHDTEGGGTVESLAAFFRNDTPGLGSSYIIEPNGRMGSVGSFTADTWHVVAHNSECIGIEQIGFARLTSTQWFQRKRQLWAAAWVVAWICQQTSIPLRHGASGRRWIAASGVVEHRDVPDNDHVDCGAAYPLGFIIELARKYQATGVPLYVRLALPSK